MLNAILPHLNALSKLFQKDHTCYSTIWPALDYTKAHIAEVRSSRNLADELLELTSKGGEYENLELKVNDEAKRRLQSLVENYTTALEENLDRFQEATPVFQAFSIFDITCLPKLFDPDFRTYGEEKMQRLSRQFNFNEDKALAQWQNFKYVMAAWEVPCSILKGSAGGPSPTTFVLRKIVKEQASHQVAFSYIIDTAKICLTQPLSNAVVERGASAVKRIKTRLRNKLQNVMFCSLLQISLNGPPTKLSKQRPC